MIPVTRAETVIHHDQPVYGGQFSDDGSFFYSFCQDFQVRMYDTTNPFNWMHYKTVRYPWPGWTITDASLSPDNRWLAYSSLTSLVCLTPTNPNDRGEPYNLDLGDSRYRGRCGIFSVRFSGDGRELVAGTNANSIVVYDIESRRALHHIRGHEDDVNAVCFADKASPHILYSGGDDSIIKVWDRRSMGNGREAGVFIGHREGITYIDSKGDGRYVLSNGKDQTMKLWDLRMVMSTEQFRHMPSSHMPPFRLSRYQTFDYRMNHYDQDRWIPHPSDNSVVTFRGHRVLRTLIRCHFSPAGSSDSRYVYSGSQDGKVFIWNLDATLASIVDVRAATRHRIPQRTSNSYHWTMRESPERWATCVRDVSWHPTAPVIIGKSSIRHLITTQ
jgi:WD repeat-containing protein 23